MPKHEQGYDGSDVQAQDPSEDHTQQVWAGLWPFEGGTTTGEVETKEEGHKNQTAKKPKQPIL